MERATIVYCRSCQQPIIRGEDFVCFKMPGSETYQFFHRRFRGGDCWHGHLENHKCHFTEPLDIQHSRFSDNRQN
jgi:hypothetical protein